MYEPAKKLELPVFAGVKVEMFAGLSCRAWPTLTIPMLSIVLESITVVGVGVVKSLVRLMRDPVTVTSSRTGAVLLASAPAAGSVCACAMPLKPKVSASATPPLKPFAKRE